MFQYAMAQKLQITLDDPHPIRFWHFLYGNHGDYDLKEFKLTENVQQIETEGSLIRQFASPMQALFSKVFAGGTLSEVILLAKEGRGLKNVGAGFLLQWEFIPQVVVYCHFQK